MLTFDKKNIKHRNGCSRARTGHPKWNWQLLLLCAHTHMAGSQLCHHVTPNLINKRSHGWDDTSCHCSHCTWINSGLTVQGPRKPFIHLSESVFCMWNMFSASQHLVLLHIPRLVLIRMPENKNDICFLFECKPNFLGEVPLINVTMENCIGNSKAMAWQV